MTIEYSVCASALGKLLVARSSKGLCSVRIRGSEAELKRLLESDFPEARLVRADRELAPMRSLILAAIGGRQPAKPVPFDLRGTDFQRSVWRELLKIPSGSTRSYGDIARAVGNRRATRAVAQACGANPIPVLVPCHRVIQSDGGLGGYTGGVRIKKALLKSEGITLP